MSNVLNGFRQAISGNNNVFYTYGDVDINGTEYTATEFLRLLQGSLTNISRVSENATADFNSYNWFCNTDEGFFTLTLPKGDENDALRIVNTGTSNNTLFIAPNAADNLLGSGSSFSLADGETLIIAYNSTEGWY